MAITKITSSVIEDGSISHSSLVDSGVTAGTHGHSAGIPVLDINSKGIITGVNVVDVAGVSSVTYNSSSGVLTIATTDGTNFNVDLSIGSEDSLSITDLTVANTITGQVSSIANHDTGDLTEGTNLYYTDTRVRTAVEGSDLDLGTNKVLYSNMYATVGDLPSATSYHGMFAHVHATGKGYFAHAGNWVELANESYVDTAINNLINSAPGTLDTLDELAAALGDDANFASTVTTSLNNKVDKINITGATVGSGTEIPVITFNAQGQITSTTTAAIPTITKATIDALNVDADTLDGVDSTQFLRSDANDTFTGNQLKLENSFPSAGGLLLVSDDGTSTTVATGTAFRVTNNGSSGSYSVLESSSGESDFVHYNNGIIELSNNTQAPIFRLTANTSQLARLEMGDGSNYTQISSRPDLGDGLMFYENGAVNTMMRDGKVGIGTTSPDKALDVAVGNDNAIRIRNENGGNTNGLSLAVGSSSPWMDITEGREFRIKHTPYANIGDWNNGSNARFVINPSGNIGIGTESPASPLDIEVGTGSWQSGLTLTRADNGNDFAFVIDGPTGNRLNIGQPSGVGRIRIEEDENGYIELASPSAVALPQGNDANRPSTPVKGDFRYNTGSNKLEYYNNTEWKEVGFYVPFSDYATSGLQLFFDANRAESWISGSNPYNIINNSQSTLSNVSNTITTDSPAGAKAMYFNDTGNCQWPGGVQPFPRTYEVWVCSKNWLGTNWQSFTDDDSQESILFGTPDASPRVYTSTSSSSTYTLSDLTWYQIAYTCNGLSSGSGTIYVNGSAAFGYSGLTRSGPATGSTLYMGGDAGGGESMFGWISILRCYDRILSSDEILQNWNNDKSKFGY